MYIYISVNIIIHLKNSFKSSNNFIVVDLYSETHCHWMITRMKRRRIWMKWTHSLGGTGVDAKARHSASFYITPQASFAGSGCCKSPLTPPLLAGQMGTNWDWMGRVGQLPGQNEWPGPGRCWLWR